MESCGNAVSDVISGKSIVSSFDEMVRFHESGCFNGLVLAAQFIFSFCKAPI